ncbi:hypothetical protein [Halochromatium glycolicum]|uniref:hypothetical protein n=1 Tax=Halochromatium glycolicum TaxID=85075 RepID=UPI00190A78DC|nr:hypothetical protein [Halochromatium glycolicum]
MEATDEDGRSRIEPVAGDGNPVDSATRDQASALCQLLSGAHVDSPSPFLSARAEELKKSHASPLVLSDEELFILRCFQDPIPERRVGEMLGGLSVRQVRYRRQQALAKIKRYLSANQITLDDLLV